MVVIKQSFIVEVKDKVRNFVEKHDKKFKNRFSKKILELEIQPIPKKKEHVIDTRNVRQTFLEFINLNFMNY
jgi:hypothetical protein